jgi:hypothetical protein
MKVCIIGGGVSGLQTADILSKNGHECHIFESESAPGGVWRENYDGYGLQVPSELYEFCNLRTMLKNGSFPNGYNVNEYIKRFIVHCQLQERCTFHFNESVENISFVNQWNIQTNQSSYSFDYCVICTGMYNNPQIPSEFDGMNVVHSSTFKDASITRDKNVAVIGGGKSAIDCAVSCSKHAKSVTIITREMHWPVPRYILGFIPFKWGTYSRLGHFLLPKHWNLTKTENSWHNRLKPLKHVVWRLLEHVFSWQFNLSKRPSIPIEIDLFNGGQILSYEFSNAIKEGIIKQIVCSNTLQHLSNMDLIISGTGFKKDYGIFDKTICDKLDLQEDGLWLYKNIIPVNVPNLAFIGSEVSTFNNILTQHLQAEWLVGFIDKPHNNSEMESFINNERTWKRSWMPFTSCRASLIQLHMVKYHDILMRDLNKQTVNSKWWQWVIPHTARDYSYNN